MSENIRRALETHLAAMSPALATAWENAQFQPTNGTPYQRAFMLYAAPDNSTLGCQRRREVGIFQITLCYPTGVGNSTAQSRAELVRDHFKRGTTVTHSGQSVLVTQTPSKTTLGVDGDRYMVAVTIPYSADIFG